MTSPWIQTTTAESFREDVVERSATVPVVVDFWAEWCQPCQQLMPLMEKLATDFDGRFVLVKINVDEQPELAGAFGVQSIPFVIAMVDGQPVSQLPGVMPEPQLREWLESFVPSPAVELYNAALEDEAGGQLVQAEEKLRSAISHDEKTAAYQIALVRVLLALDRDAECEDVLATLESRGFLEPEAQQLKDQLETRTAVEDSGGITAAREAAAANPEDVSLRIKLAEALGAEKRYDEACDILLEVIQLDRSEKRDAAKDAMVTVLTAMGPKSQKASDYRRRLATAFY